MLSFVYNKSRGGYVEIPTLPSDEVAPSAAGPKEDLCGSTAAVDCGLPQCNRVAAEDATGGQEKKSGYTSSGKEYRQGLGAAEDAFPWLLLLGAALGAILAGALVVRSFAASSSSEGRGGAMRGAGGRDATLPYSDLLLGKSLPIIPLPSMPHPMTPSALWGRSSGKPYPTGAFWTNFVIDNGDWAVGVLPYAVKCTSAGVQVSYGAWRRIVSKGAITDPFFADMQISALEAYLGHSVDSYDSFSVTMRFDVSGGLFRAPLVKGSPFVTAVFQGSTPTVSSELMQFIAVDVATMPANQPGSLRIVTLGNYQKWLVYCSATAPLIWNGNTLSTNVPISGFVRIAFIPKQNEAASIAILSKHLLRYPTGASASFSYPSPHTALMTVSFASADPPAGLGGELLMMSLAHHQDLWDHAGNGGRANVSEYSPVYCAKGRMVPVVGSVWKLSYDLLQVGWGYESALASTISTDQLNAIAASLQRDIAMEIEPSADSYRSGKLFGRMAALALIADYLGIPSARQAAVSELEALLYPWVCGRNADALVYDRTWGGVVPSQGLLKNDPLEDFGASIYNDHHFHYGYFIYAGAVLAKLDNPFWQTNRLFFDALVKDICNYDPKDMDFPFARHKDLFDGHSWASGLHPQGNGKSQESSSEASHAYYAAYLYGVATDDAELTRFAQMMMSMEVQAVKTYWHMKDDSAVYDRIFVSNRMVGNVGALDVTASTWFGNKREYVSGINMMPVSPLTALLFDADFVAKQWPLMYRRIRDNPVLQPSCMSNPGIRYPVFYIPIVYRIIS